MSLPFSVSLAGQTGLDGFRKDLLRFRQERWKKGPRKFSDPAGQRVSVDQLVDDFVGAAAEILHTTVPFIWQRHASAFDYKSTLPPFPAFPMATGFHYPLLVETREGPYWIFCRPGPRRWDYQFPICSCCGGVAQEADEPFLNLVEGVLFFTFYPHLFEGTTLLACRSFAGQDCIMAIRMNAESPEQGERMEANQVDLSLVHREVVVPVKCADPIFQ